MLIFYGAPVVVELAAVHAATLLKISVVNRTLGVLLFRANQLDVSQLVVR